MGTPMMPPNRSDFDDDVTHIESLYIMQAMNKGLTNEHVNLIQKLIARMLPCEPTADRAGVLVGLHMAADVLRDAGEMWHTHYAERIAELERSTAAKRKAE